LHFAREPTLRVRPPRFVVKLKSSIAPIQGVACVFVKRLLMQYVKHVQHVQYAAHQKRRASAAFPPVQNDNGTHRT